MLRREKRTIRTLWVSAILILSACNDEVDTAAEAIVLDEATAAAVVDFSNDDIDNIVLNNLDAIGTRTGGGEANNGRGFNPYGGRDSCAEITHDETSQTITVDFGEGCSNGDELVRSGQIIISYTDRRNIAGAVITTTFNDFRVNGNLIEGTRTLTNISDGTMNQRAFRVVTENGKITFEDGTTRTFQGTRTRTHMLEETSQELTITVEGSRSGINREGVAFSMEITAPLVFTYSCRQVGVRVAISGVRTLTRDSETTTIDYGTGTCDNEVTVTRPDGTTEIVEVRNRRRRG
ncbi:MAG: hypothetical protein Roseis2KO_42690 [Roseivirga sp.]